MSTDIEKHFKYAVDQIKSSEHMVGEHGPDNNEKMRFYELYKQATIGKCNTERPNGYLDFTGKMKWDAWKSVGDMTRENAMIAYCALYAKVNEKYNQ